VFRVHTLPIIRHIPAAAKILKGFKLFEGTSAESSGGLLVALKADRAEDFIKELSQLVWNSSL